MQPKTWGLRTSAAIAFGGVLCLAALVISDAYFVTSVFNPENSEHKLAAMMAFLSLSASVVSLTVLVICLLFGKKVSPHFEGWKTIRIYAYHYWREACISSALLVVGEVIMIYAFLSYDVSMAVIMVFGVLAFPIAFSSWIENSSLRKKLQPIIFGGGAFLVCAWGDDFGEWLEVVLVVFLGANILALISQYVDDQALNERNSINVMVYQTICSLVIAAISIILSLIVITLKDQVQLYLELLHPSNSLLIVALIAIFGAMGLIGSYLMNQAGGGISSQSMAAILTSLVPICFGAILLGDLLFPNSLGRVTTEPVVLIYRTIGLAVISFYTYLLYKAEIQRQHDARALANAKVAEPTV
jgi:hypothetical protein